MKNNFTRLIQQFFRQKRYTVPLGSLVVVLVTALTVWAVINPIAVQNVPPVSADTAVGGPAAGFTVLNDIVIQEGNQRDFKGSTSATFTLTAPEGWVFRQSGVVGTTTGGNITINNAGIAYSTTANPATITIPFSVSGENRVDAFTISGVALQAQTGAILPSRPVTLAVSGTTIDGFTSPTTVANISQTHGSAKSLTFKTQPSPALTNDPLSTQPVVEIKDWFGNTVTTGTGATSAVSLAIGTNPGGGVLSPSPATVTAVNGVATFSGLSIDKAGVDYTLLPSSGSLTAVASSPFTISNKKPTIDGISPCLSQADPATTVTITGTNFVSGATVLVNGVSRSATVASATSLTTVISATELAAAGSLSVVVKNPAPVQDNGESNALTVAVNSLLTTAVPSGAASVCVNTAGSTYTIPAVAGASSYQWTVSGGATITGGANTTNATVDFGNAAGDVQLSVVALNVCGKPGAASVLNVKVNAYPEASITTPNGLEACAGSTVALHANAVTGATYQWQLENVNVANSNADPSIFYANTSGNYRVVVTQNNCATTSDAVAVIINTPPTASISGATEFCAESATVLTAVTDKGTGYVWYRNGVAMGGETANALSITEGGDYTVKITDAKGCFTTSAVYTVTKKELPSTTITYTGPLTFCDGDEIILNAPAGTGYTYQWQLNGSDIVGQTNAAFTARETGSYRVVVTSNGCSKVSEALDILVKPNPAARIQQGATVAFCEGTTTTLDAELGKNYTYRWFKDGVLLSGQTAGSLEVSDGGSYTVEVTLDGCVSISAPTVVTKKPLPTAEITPASATDFCQGGSVQLNASTGSGYTYRWFKDGGSTAISTTASYTTSTAGSYTVEVTLNGCSKLSAPEVVTINPYPDATITPTGPTNFCEGNSVVLNAPSAPVGQVYNYEWFKDGGAAAFEINQNIEVVVSGSYTLKVTTDKGCSTTSAAIIVKVQKEAAATITYSGATEFCEGGSILFKAPAAPSGQTYTYQWLKDGNTVSGATDATYTATATGDYSVTVSNVDSEVTCSKTSDAVAVMVLPQPVATVTSGNEAKCIGADNTTTFSVAADFSGGTPLWSSSSSGFVIQNPIYNTATGKATATVVATGTGSANITLQTTNTKTACNNASSSVALTVNPLPETTITAASATTFCQDGSVVLSAPEGTYTYQWLRNGAVIATAGTEREYTATTAGDYTVRVTNTATGCVATTASATTVTVNPQPTVTASASPTSKCVGEGNTTVFDLTGTATNGTPLWSFVSSTGTATVSSFSSPTTGNTQVTVAGIGSVVVRLTSSSAVASCNDAIKDITLIVNPYPTANAGPDLVLCVGNGNKTTFERQASGSEGAVSWTVKSTTEGVEVTNLAYPFLYNSFVEVTGIGSAVLLLSVTNNGCTTTDEVVLTVKPRPTVDVVENKTYCNGAAGAAISFGSSLPGSTFAWTSSRDIGFGTSGEGNIPAYTATNTGTSPVTATVRVRATADDCQGAEQSFTITVNPTPKLNSSLAPPAICSGTEFNYLPTSATADASFAWTRAAVDGISNAAVTTPVAGGISETLVNTTTAPIKVTYVYTTTANNCSGQPQNVEVTVNPRPVLSSTLNPAAICSGTSFSYTPTSATSGATFSWTRLEATGITTASVASGSGAINHVLTNTTAAPIDVTYRFTTTANGCSGTTTQDVMVRVNPTPQINNIPVAATVCSGNNFTFTPTSATAGAAYSWTRAAVTGISNAAVTTPVAGGINENLVNTTANPIDVTYVYTTTANGCSGPTQSIVVRVNPKPVLTSSLAPAAICSGTTFSYTPTSATTGATYSWTRAAVDGISNAAVTTPVAGGISETLVNTTTSAINVTYVYTTSANGCTNTENIIVAVNPLPTVSYTGLTDGQNIYTGQGSISLVGSPTGGTFTGPGISGNTFNPCNAGAPGPKTITYTFTNASGCTNTVSKTINLIKSQYRVIVKAIKPFPFCRGENVEYESFVYRDAEIIYPYLVNDKGEPVDRNGKLIAPGAGSFPIANENYPFPANTPEIVKAQAFRFFQPIIVGGTRLDPNLFTYQWTKNEDVNRKNGNYITSDAGLSSQDYYGVYVTSKSGAFCDEVLNSQISNRLYSAELPDYAVTLAVAQNPVCLGSSVTFTASLNGNFEFWAIANLQLEFVLTRGSTTYSLGTFPYNGSNTVQFTSDGAIAGGFVNGDKVQVNFSSDVDPFRANTKCAGKENSNAITIEVLYPPVITRLDNQIVCAGQEATFTVSATGAGLVYTWYKDGSTNPIGTGNPFKIPNVTAASAGTYRVVVSGTCGTPAEASATLTVTPLPIAYTVTGGGSYCTGGAGMPVGLNNSQTDVSYQLYRGTSAVGSPVTGTGGALDFGAFTEAGVYTVKATTIASSTAAGNCPQDMLGSATINITPLPIEYTVTGGGSLCAGSTTGVAVGLSNSQTTVSYQLYNGTSVVGSPVTGTGGAIDFGAFTEAGVYTVKATTIASSTTAACPQDMLGSATVYVTAIPEAYNIISTSTSYCAGGAGVSIGLDNSQANVTYTLYQSGTATPLATVKRTAAGAFYFDGSFTAGDYTVTATTDGTQANTAACPITMTGTITVTEEPLPVAQTGLGGSYCYVTPDGVEITIASSQVGINYQLMLGTATIGTVKPGTGSLISFGKHTAGAYTIVATNPTTTCSTEISVPVTEEQVLTFKATVTSDPDTAKIDEPITFTAVVENGGTNPSFQWYMRNFETHQFDLVPGETNKTFTIDSVKKVDELQVMCLVKADPATACVDNFEFEAPSNVMRPLPVEIIYLTAQRKDNMVLLTWATASETENTGFEVEVSQDGFGFRKIGFVPTKNGNSAMKQVYEFTDKENGKHGTRYYRLKQIDENGTVAYFGPRAVTFAERAEMIVASPNPFHTEINLDINSEADTDLVIILTSMTGRELMRRTVKVKKGISKEQLQLDKNLATGVYILTTRMNNLTTHFKLLKQ